MVKENVLRLTLTLFPQRYTSSCRRRRDTLILIAFGIMGRQKGTKQLIASPILGIAGIKRAQALSCVSSLFSTRFCLYQLRARSCCHGLTRLAAESIAAHSNALPCGNARIEGTDETGGRGGVICDQHTVTGSTKCRVKSAICKNLSIT